MLHLNDILAEKYCILAEAEHAYDGQKKFKNTTMTATMCSKTSLRHLKKNIPWETPREHGKKEKQPCSPCLFKKCDEEKCTNQYGIDSWDALFADKHSWISGGLKITVHEWTRLRSKTIPTAAERARRENTWVLVLNSSGPNGPMTQREDYRETTREFVNDSFKNLAKLTTDFILESKFECDQTNNLLGTKKVRSASTPKQAGSGMTLDQQQASATRWQPSSWWQSSAWSQTSMWGERYFLQAKVFRLQAMAIPV